MENSEEIPLEPSFNAAKLHVDKYSRSRDLTSLKTQLNDWKNNIKFNNSEIERFKTDLIEMKKLYERDSKQAEEQIEIRTKDGLEYKKIITLIEERIKPLEEQAKIKALEEQKKKVAEMKSKIPLSNKSIPKSSIVKEEK